MEEYEIIGLIGMVCLVAAIYPQMFRIYQRKTSGDISLSFLAVGFIGCCFLIVYSFIIDSLTFKILEILLAINLATMLILSIKYRKKEEK